MLAAGYGEAMYSDENVADYVARNHVGGTATGRIRVLSEHTPNLEFEIAFKRIPDRLFTRAGARPSPSTGWPSCRHSSTGSRLNWMGGPESEGSTCETINPEPASRL